MILQGKIPARTAEEHWTVWFCFVLMVKMGKIVRTQKILQVGCQNGHLFLCQVENLEIFLN